MAPVLAVVSYDDQLCPRSLHGGEKASEVDIRCHGALVEDQHVAVGELQGVVVESPGKRGDSARLDPGTLSEVPCCLSGGGGAEHAVAGALEALADRRQRRCFPGSGHTHDEIKTVPTHQESDRHLVLGGGERDAEALFEAGSSIERGLLFDLRPVIASQ